jgi:hypothetical protein
MMLNCHLIAIRTLSSGLHVVEGNIHGYCALSRRNEAGKPAIMSRIVNQV